MLNSVCFTSIHGGMRVNPWNLDNSYINYPATIWYVKWGMCLQSNEHNMIRKEIYVIQPTLLRNHISKIEKGKKGALVTPSRQRQSITPYVEGILPKGPYPPCVSMADRALLAGYPGCIRLECWVNCAGGTLIAQFQINDSLSTGYIHWYDIP